MSVGPLPYCDDIDYIGRGKKGDCIPRDRDAGTANVAEPNGGIITEINTDPVVANEHDLLELE